MKPTVFKSKKSSIPLPVFFPDATRAVIRTLDSHDIEQTNTPGVLVNTYHLYKELGKKVLRSHGGIRGFMDWSGGVISDSGGFQVMSIVKKTGGGRVTDRGVSFRESKKKSVLLTPEKSVAYQMDLDPDMVVVLDDFTAPGSSRKDAEMTVARTIAWAQRSKDEFERQCASAGLSPDKRPYLLGVVQGGEHLDLREACTKALVAIGFDGLGYGGWPIRDDGTFNYDVARVIRDHTPEDYLLYGLGIGKPHEIAQLVRSGWHIFDCVLPTRDARHKRLYVYTADSMESIDVEQEKFYTYFSPDKEAYYNDTRPVSTACDCLLCTRYSRAYLAHLFRIGDSSAYRLATIHNLRFYALLMENLRMDE